MKPKIYQEYQAIQGKVNSQLQKQSLYTPERQPPRFSLLRNNREFFRFSKDFPFFGNFPDFWKTRPWPPAGLRRKCLYIWETTKSFDFFKGFGGFTSFQTLFKRESVYKHEKQPNSFIFSWDFVVSSVSRHFWKGKVFIYMRNYGKCLETGKR